MLITCPECSLQVSDKANACPHCGYPMKTENIKVPKKRTPKRRRLPNGFGQISEIKNLGLRKPFRALVTVGMKENGRPLVRPLKPESYFETYNDAYAALLEYNRNPYDLEDDLTLKQLHDRWSEAYYKEVTSATTIRTMNAAWKYCSALYDMRAKDIRARHIKGLMENNLDKNPSPSTKARIKSLFNLMLDYAVEYEIVDTNYARTFEISKDTFKDIEDNRKEHIAFTDEEISRLWANLGKIPYVELVIVQCYMGWRPQELGNIRVENVDLDKWQVMGGMKTDAGFNRIVPVHTAIRPVIKDLYDKAVKEKSEYLIFCSDTVSHKASAQMTYDKYHGRFGKVVDALNLNPQHRPHDPRKQFITMCKNAKVDEFAIKYMVGHKVSDITEAIYTQRPEGWLAEEIEKIEVKISC